MDGDLAGGTPATDVTASNVTLCGSGREEAALTYGLVLREQVRGTLDNIVVSGFDAGVDTRDESGSTDEPHATFEHSLMFENLVHAVAYDEPDTNNSDSPRYDDDFGFDERAGSKPATATSATNERIRSTESRRYPSYRSLPQDGYTQLSCAM